MAVLAAIYLGLGAFLGLPPFTGQATSPSNTEILLDQSLAMEEPFFEGLTKMEAAVLAIDNQLLSQQLGAGNSLALRQYGGACNGANTRIAVPFASDNEDRIGAALSELDVGGDATFAQGMAEGTRDFGIAEEFEGSINTIIGIAGSGDFCAPVLAARVLNDQIHKVESRITIRVIGLGLPSNQKTDLEEAVGAMGGKTFFVATTAELEDALGAIVLELQENRQRLAAGDDSFLQTPIPILGEVPPGTPSSAAVPTDNAGDADSSVGSNSVVEPAATQLPAANQAPTATLSPTATPAAAATATATPLPTSTSTPVPTSTPTLAAPTPRPAPTAPVVLQPTATAIPPSTETPTPLPKAPDCYATVAPTPPTPSGQSFPHVIVGTVTIDGAPAPDGTVVTAWVDGNLAAATTLSQGKFGFSLEPPPGQSYVGKTVFFNVGECEASPTIAWQAGEADPINLTATSAQ